MKPSIRNLFVTAFLLGASAHASTLYWDGAATTVNNQSDNTTTTGQNWLSGGNWDNGTTSAPVASWVSGDSAIFGGTAATQTITASPITVGNLTFGGGVDGSGSSGTAYTVSNNTITLSSSTITANTLTSINSVLAGSTGLIKSGVGQLTLGGTNTFSGGTILSTGTLKSTSDGAFAAGTVTINDANTGSANTTLSTSANGGGTPVRTNIIVANQGSGTTTFEVTAQNSSFAGSTIQLNKAVTVQSNYTGGGGGIFGKYDGTSVVSGNVGTLTLRALGTGKLYFSGNNTFVGTINITQGEVWSFGHVNSFGSGNPVVMSGTAIMGLFSAGANIGDLTGAAGNTINTSASGNNLLTVTSVNPTTFAGVISGGGGFTKAGAATQTLSGTNTYTGTTAISGGTLQIGGSGKLNASGLYAGSIVNTATLEYSSSANQTFSGVISGSGGKLTKDTGSGTLTLSNTNTYSGATVVSAGVLSVTGTISSSPSIDVQSGGTLSLPIIVSGQTLKGTGAVSSNTTIQAGATLSPAGAGAIGTLAANGSTFTLAGTSAFEINKTGPTLTSDSLGGSANVTFGGTLTVTATGDALALGDTFTLFSNSGSRAGTFPTINLPSLSPGLFWNTTGLASTGTITVDAVVFTSTPSFSPTPGGYAGAQSVSITSDSGSTIYYTTDGSTPTNLSTSGASPITGITVPDNSTNFTIKAFAVKSGQSDSPVETAIYNTVTTPSWNVDNNGLWSEPSNWLSTVIPDGSGAAALFAYDQGGDTTVTLDTSRTVGSLTFDNVNPINWTITSGGSVLTLAGGSPAISVLNNTATLAASLAGSSGLIKSGNGTLKLTRANTLTGPVAVTAGTLNVGGGTASGSIPTSAVTVDSGATLAFQYNSAFTAVPLAVTGNLSYTSTAGLTLPAGTYAANQLGVTGANVTVGGALAINAGAGGATLTGTSTSAAGIMSPTVDRNITTTGDITLTGISSAGSFIDGISLNGVFTATSGTLTFDGTASSGGAYGMECGVSGLWIGSIKTVGNVVFKGTGGTTRNADLFLGDLTGHGTVTLVGRSKGLNKNTTFTSSDSLPYNVVIQTINGCGINGLLASGTDNTGNGNYSINSAAGVTFGARTINAGTGAISLTSTSGYSITDNVSLTAATLTMGDSQAIAINSGKTLTLNTTGTIPNIISGGGVTVAGGTVTLSGANTYTGNTTVTAGTVVLDASGSLTLAPTTNGVSNKVTGGGAATLNGALTLNLAGANTTPGNTWALVETASYSYGGTFNIPGFTVASHVWTMTSGGSIWTFTESTGILSVAAANSYATWAATNAGGGGATGDYDNDGVLNGVEYFMGQTGSSITPNPTMDAANKITWPRDPAANATYVVQTSIDLTNWVPAPSGVVDNGTSIEYTVPYGDTARFARIKVIIP